MVAGILVIASSSSIPVSAASGFVMSPAFQQAVVSPNQARYQYNLRITNASSTDQSFRLSTQDFGSLDEQGGVAFLGQPANELEHRYGLASWMLIEKDIVFVPSGKTVPIIVTIDNRSSLSPGGHYGAVLATAVSDAGLPQVGDPHVGLKVVVASLILLRKEGGAEASLKLVDQTVDSHLWKLPQRVEQRFQNPGNIHVVPRGIIEVRDPAGRLVERAAINAESSVILPESFRRYKTPLTRLATAWLPGRYRVVTHYRYDGQDAAQSFTRYFWYGGTAVTWAVAIGLLALTLLGSIMGLRRLRRRRRI